MNIFPEFLAAFQREKPELDQFTNRIKIYFNESGFQSVQFERAIDSGLVTIEADIKKRLTVDQDESKKDNN